VWVMTTDGFFSAVAHRTRPDDVMIRARVRDDLERAFPEAEILADEKADYPYRVIVGRGVWGAYLAHAAVTISYDNFKSAITEQKRHNVYLSVWAVLRRLSWPSSGAGAHQPTLFGDDPYDRATGTGWSGLPLVSDEADVEQKDCDWCGHPFELHYLLDSDPDAGCSACPDKRCTEASAHVPRCTCTEMCDSYDWTPCPVHPEGDSTTAEFSVSQDVRIHVEDEGFGGGAHCG
jgi:hypothetical protein